MLRVSRTTNQILHISNVLTSHTRMSSKQVTFPSENKLGDGKAVVIGEASGSTKGLIVIHEWWGMNDHIQQKGGQLAKDGNLVVLVPDLYRGKVAEDREEAGHYMADLDWAGAVKDLQGAARYLLSAGCTKVGVTGFCMGGALSFAAAALIPEISASAPFYGIPSPQLADLTKIKIPVQAHFGEKDTVVGFSSPSDYEPLRERLLNAGVPLEFHTYDAGHAFTNSTNKEMYSPEACKLATTRMLQFMNNNLT